MDVLRGWSVSPFANRLPEPPPPVHPRHRDERGSPAVPAGASRVRAAVLVAASAVLLWLTAGRSLTAFLATVSPRTALKVDGSNTAALTNLADALMRAEIKAAAPADAGRPAADPARLAQESRDRRAEIADLARRAVLSDPQDARAFRILGQLAILDGDAARTRTLLRAAVARSLTEPVAVSWLMLDRIEDRDAAGAARLLDILLRVRPLLYFEALPAAVNLLGLPGGTAQLAALLGREPPWRDAMLRTLPNRVVQPMQILDLLLAMRDTPAPPRPEDMKAYLNLLMQRGRFEIAYYAWLQFLSEADLGTLQAVYDGGFEKAPTALPFDWAMSAGAGASVEIEADPDQPAGHVLHVAFSAGRVAFGGVEQTLMLAPGSYTLSGRFRLNLVGQRGLVWRLRCAGTDRTLGETAMLIGRQAAWKTFAVEMRVPDADCRAQTLRLELDARSASERLVHGDAWFDDIAVMPAAGSR